MNIGNYKYKYKVNVSFWGFLIAFGMTGAIVYLLYLILSASLAAIEEN